MEAVRTNGLGREPLISAGNNRRFFTRLPLDGLVWSRSTEPLIHPNDSLTERREEKQLLCSWMLSSLPDALATRHFQLSPMNRVQTELLRPLEAR